MSRELGMRELGRDPVYSEDGRFMLSFGAWVPRDPHCPACGQQDALRCFPGAYPKCFRCGVTVIRYGRAPSADCVTPNGRIDGHMAYVKGAAGHLVCAFCGGAGGKLPRGCVELGGE